MHRTRLTNQPTLFVSFPPSLLLLKVCDITHTHNNNNKTVSFSLKSDDDIDIKNHTQRIIKQDSIPHLSVAICRHVPSWLWCRDKRKGADEGVTACESPLPAPECIYIYVHYWLPIKEPSPNQSLLWTLCWFLCGAICIVAGFPNEHFTTESVLMEECSFLPVLQCCTTWRAVAEKGE